MGGGEERGNVRALFYKGGRHTPNILAIEKLTGGSVEKDFMKSVIGENLAGGGPIIKLGKPRKYSIPKTEVSTEVVTLK